ncbi:hypothetical protein NBM05_06010 [Rothia sp. AR01]|uniref:Uncharacterized protein n=1 Tax=Rothia santali TaxID=2949643 RepID=A0A9X2H9P1_9MICC|nr:hypothetical protein [Rothia santali]MCP3425579.1 hypothetical protein [Rothia santali]
MASHPARTLPPALVVVISTLCAFVVNVVVGSFTDLPTVIRWALAIMAALLVTKLLIPPRTGPRPGDSERDHG